MSNKSHHTPSPPLTDAIDASATAPALARIYCSSVARLTELSLEVARQSVEDCVSATRIASAAGSRGETGAYRSALGQPVFERTLAYFRDSYEIITQAQTEAMQLFGRQFSTSGFRFPVPEDWNAAFQMFARGTRRFSEMTTENVSAATEAASKLADDVEWQHRKAA